MAQKKWWMWKKKGVVASYFWLYHLIWHGNRKKKLTALNYLEKSPLLNISFILCTRTTAGLTKITGVWKADFPPGSAQDRYASCQKTRTCGSQAGDKKEAMGRKCLNVVGRTWQGRTSSQGWEQWQALRLPSPPRCVCLRSSQQSHSAVGQVSGQGYLHKPHLCHLPWGL